MKNLNLRAAQYDALEQYAVTSFIQRLLEHLRDKVPEHWEMIAESDGLKRCHELYLRALALGFTTEEEVARFVEVVSLTVPTFGLQPGHAMALQMLAEDDVVQSWPDERGLILALAMAQET